jgi:hypothetical protein
VRLYVSYTARLNVSVIARLNVLYTVRLNVSFTARLYVPFTVRLNVPFTARLNVPFYRPRFIATHYPSNTNASWFNCRKSTGVTAETPCSGMYTP